MSNRFTVRESEDGYHYVRFSELLDGPLFEYWMRCQTRPLPVVNGEEIRDAAYLHDYLRFKEQNGRPDGPGVWD